MNILNISNYKLGTAAYQRGEQTINKDTKTVGGIKGFSSDHMNVTKWCLNRPNLSTVESINRCENLKFKNLKQIS